MKSYPNKRTLLFYFFSMLFLGSILSGVLEVTILIHNPTIEKETLNTLVESILQFSIYLIIFIGILLLMRNFYKDEFAHFKTKVSRFITIGVIGWLATYGILIIYSMILTQLNYETGVPQNQQEIENIFRNYPYFIVPVLIFGAPFIEETIFRGIMFRTINNLKLPYKLNLILAFIISSGIFGFIHVLTAFLITKDVKDIIDGIPYFISGFVLTFVYYKTKNIYVPMITHFLHNTSATLLMFIAYLLRDFLPEELSSSTILVLLKLLHLH